MTRKSIWKNKLHPKGMKGKHHTPEAREKMRVAHLGEKNYAYGTHLSEEHRRKISENNARHMLGKHHTNETKEKMSLASKGKNKGKNNGMWVGDNIKSYPALHQWIRRNKPKPQFCESFGCVNQPYDVANISGLYKRDISDFRWECRSCHMKEDGRLLNLRNCVK